ncbi:MAG: hypothetical protein J5I52_02010, partial [Saprospiraceae bacterium]|nr:hypothetical protein [Saprospiraceae bacterium]
NKFSANLFCKLWTKIFFWLLTILQSFLELFICDLDAQFLTTFCGLAQWRISEHKTVNKPQKLMRGKMFN